MKIYVLKTERGVSTGTIPFRENSVSAIPAEVTEEELAKIQDPKFINKFEDGKFSFEAVPLPAKTPEELKKEEIVAKIDSGKATTSDLIEAVKILIKN